jgi:hypothetical protein
LIDLLRSELVPKLPKGFFIQSILLVDSFWLDLNRIHLQLPDGWSAWYGYATLVLKVRNTAAMDAGEKQMYCRSILASVAAKMLTVTRGGQLQKDFFSISRDLSLPLIGEDVYTSTALEFLFTDIPPAEDLGFLHYITTFVAFDGYEYIYQFTPREEDDLRMFLMAVLTYPSETFNALYAGHISILKKFEAMKGIAKASGLHLPE